MAGAKSQAMGLHAIVPQELPGDVKIALIILTYHEMPEIVVDKLEREFAPTSTPAECSLF